MTTAYKLLGQITPTSNTMTNLYTTATATQAIVGTITIHNFSDSNGSYSILVRPTARCTFKHSLSLLGAV
jgi:hypothetical protein